MSTDDIKGYLSAIVTIMQMGEKQFPVEVSKQIITFLNEMSEINREILATVLQTTPEKVKEFSDQLIPVLEKANTLFTTGEADKIISFAQKLSNKPVLLEIISLQM